MSATSQLGFVSWDLFQMHSRLLVRVQKSNIETKIIEKNKKKKRIPVSHKSIRFSFAIK